MLLHELHILPAVLREILIFLNAADIAFPSGQLLQNGLRLFQLPGYGELLRHLAVHLIAHADGNLIQIAQHIQHRKGHIRGSLQTAAVSGSHTVKPAHAARPSRGRPVLAAVSAAASQFIRFLSENLGYEGSRADRRGISLADGDHLFDLIGRNSGADRAIGRQRGGRGHHGIDAVIRVLQSSQLSLQQDVLSFLQRLVQETGGVAHIGRDHFLIFHHRVVQLIHIEQGLVI